MVKVTYQRPSGSRETITIAGSSAVTSTSGQDQTNRQRRASLGQPQLAAAQGERAAGVVRGLPAAPRDLNRGCRARLANNAVNAWCWCRSACCNGTEDTSDKNASSGSFFMAVSARSDSAYDVPLWSAAPTAVPGGQGAVHTTRTQPNVRVSTSCCAWSG